MNSLVSGKEGREGEMDRMSTDGEHINKTENLVDLTTKRQGSWETQRKPMMQ